MVRISKFLIATYGIAFTKRYRIIRMITVSGTGGCNDDASNLVGYLLQSKSTIAKIATLAEFSLAAAMSVVSDFPLFRVSNS